MLDLNAFRVDLNKEKDGVWLKYGKDTRFLIARKGNPNYNALLGKLSKPHLHEIRNDHLDQETSKEIMVQVMAETILLGWEGLTCAGIPVPYSKEKAIEILSNEEFKTFYNWVDMQSDSLEHFRQAAIEGALGN